MRAETTFSIPSSLVPSTHIHLIGTPVVTGVPKVQNKCKIKKYSTHPLDRAWCAYGVPMVCLWWVSVSDSKEVCSKVVQSCVVKQVKPGVPKVSALVSANFEVYFTTQLFKYLTTLLFTTQVSVLVSTKRPGGIDAILHSLARQTNQDFELVQIAQQKKNLVLLKSPARQTNQAFELVWF